MAYPRCGTLHHRRDAEEGFNHCWCHCHSGGVGIVGSDGMAGGDGVSTDAVIAVVNIISFF